MYATYAAIMIRPFALETFFVFAITINGMIIVATNTAISNTYELLTFIGKIVADAPIIRKILKIFEPTTLPTAISLSPFLAAITDVTNSGRDVPHATIVRPISASLRPKNLAISFAPSTDKSPPKTMPASPIPINNKIDSREGHL